MKYVIVGTAGHVDHGKTTLIQQLTGVDTDRLTEEKKRGISIELGFAPFTLPGGRLAGVVDVPGHEKFIKHMLAGAGGMDVVLLVIASNEGVMPQTLEHLYILDLLEIEKGILVLTKKDLVDPEWMALVEQDIRDAVQGTFMENAPVVAISALDGSGLETLKETIDAVTRQVRGKDEDAPFRLPIDRIFTIKGAGTVVTGTLASGRLKTGAIAEVLPSQKQARVRQLQVHGKKMDEAAAGQRVAVNLAGIEVNELERGNVIAQPGLLVPTQALDIKLKLLAKPFGKETRRPIHNRERVRFHTGTQEILGRVLLLDSDFLEPGKEGYAQIFLEEEAVVARGDHFIIRSYSPVTTVGGGIVIEPYAKKHKRYRQEVIDEMMIKEQGTPDELIEQHLLQDPEAVVYRDGLAKDMGLTDTVIEDALKGLMDKGKVKIFNVDQRDWVVHATILASYGRWVQDYLERFHRQQPLKAGVTLEELRSKLFKGFSPRVFSVLLVYFAQQKILTQSGQKVKLTDYQITLTAQQEMIRNSLLEAWNSQPYSPPSAAEVAQAKNFPVDEAEAVADAMIEMGEAVRIQSGDIILTEDAWNRAVDLAKSFIDTNGGLTLAEFRDGLQTSRKYALAMLEHMDEKRITKRMGDKRVLSK